MTEFTIEKGIPLGKIRKRQCGSKFPWKEMEIGDSFFSPRKSGLALKEYSTTYGIKLTQRAVVENGIKGYRIWRTK